ncbi:MAG: MarR family transcriptional regulator [Candidatus Nanopelagicales bacterium]
MTLNAREQRAIPQLRTAVMRLSRRMRQERHDDQLTPSALSVLGSLAQDGPLTATELASREHVRPPTMSRIVGTLENDGWVTREPDPADGRQSLISLTNQANDWIATYRQVRDRWLAEQWETLDPDERATLMAAIPILEQLVQGAPSRR